MKTIYQDFIKLIESKPTSVDSIKRMEYWRKSYKIEKGRMDNVFDNLFSRDELFIIYQIIDSNMKAVDFNLSVEEDRETKRLYECKRRNYNSITKKILVVFDLLSLQDYYETETKKLPKKRL